MLEKLQKIIASENPKNPLSDEQLAQLLSLRREKVIALRTQAGIGNFRERRRNTVTKDALRILHAQPDISERAFAAALKKLGYAVSRYAAATIKHDTAQQQQYLDIPEQALETARTNCTQKRSPENQVLTAIEPFANIIGYRAGLQVQINQAKAAILYPPCGLNTLITGPSGTGKSYLAESMYHFAVEQSLISPTAAFIVFNCADYADNPQLLLAQLFGYAKGAFSGAVADRAGLVEKAAGGILFLDEVHRLPSEGQEILFSILDKGEFRRLGNTATVKINLRIIAATTENIESSLLLTFRRRIPMLIDLPPLSERPLEERYALICHFFKAEAAKTKRLISVDKKVLRFLLLYKCPGNIGQLLSDIRVACANAFLASVAQNRDEVSIHVRDLNKYETIQVLAVQKEAEVEKYLETASIFTPLPADRQNIDSRPNWNFDTIYNSIEEDVHDLRRSGLDNAQINEVVQRKIKEKIKEYAIQKGSIDETIAELSSVVNTDIIPIVKNAVKLAKSYIPELETRIYYFLAIHLNTFFERMNRGIYRKFSVDLKNIVTRYKREYEVACIIAKGIESGLHIKFPAEEIGMIAMYLYTFSHPNQVEESRVKVLVLSHGHVASAMAETANRLLNMDYAIGIDMDFSESPESMLDKVVHIVERVDEGNGCLLLVDIGSLVSIDKLVTARTGVRTTCIERVDTAMVLEAIRRAALTTINMDDIASALRSEKFSIPSEEDSKPPALLFTCITGEGTARRLKDVLQERIHDSLKGFKLFTVGALDEQRMQGEIHIIREQCRLIAVIGNIRPLGIDVPFLSSQEIFSGDGINRLEHLLKTTSFEAISLGDVLQESAIICQLELSDKTQIIDKLSELLYQQGAIDEGFLLSAYKRESTGITYLNGGIGIPHGSSEHVIKPAIAMANLVRPVLWESNFMVDLVFLLAFKEENQSYINEFYHIISNKNALKLLKEATSPVKIKQILINKQF